MPEVFLCLLARSLWTILHRNYALAFQKVLIRVTTQVSQSVSYADSRYCKFDFPIVNGWGCGRFGWNKEANILQSSDLHENK